MTTITPHPDGDCAETVSEILDWLDGADVSAESLSAAFDVLAERRRRVALSVLREYDDDLTLADLAEEVARCEATETDRLADISPETVTEVYVSLYHDHVPRLVDADLLEYEQERDLVKPASL